MRTVPASVQWGVESISTHTEEKLNIPTLLYEISRISEQGKLVGTHIQPLHRNQ